MAVVENVRIKKLYARRAKEQRWRVIRWTRQLKSGESVQTALQIQLVQALAKLRVMEENFIRVKEFGKVLNQRPSANRLKGPRFGK